MENIHIENETHSEGSVNLGHLMVDIETFATHGNSVICSLAAVEFNLATGETGSTFKYNINIESCLHFGLTVDGATINWWLDKSDAARAAVQVKTENLQYVLLRFAEFVKNKGVEDLQVWGNGSRFDLGILSNAYLKTGQLIPWDHRNERDVRTLVSFAPEIKQGIDFEGIRHEPLDDCLHQIKYCTATYHRLTNTVASPELKTLSIRSNHAYYFVESGVLCEMYNTIRGERWNPIKRLPDYIIDMKRVSRERAQLLLNGEYPTVNLSPSPDRSPSIGL